jgi:flagellar protein FlaG
VPSAFNPRIAEQDNIMVSEIQGGGGSFAPSVNPRVQTPAQAQAMGALPQRPQVSAPPKVQIEMPKPADIKYDAGEIKQSLQEAVRILNQQVSSKTQGLGFSYDSSIKNAVITVRNLETGHVIRQIPGEDALRMAHNLDQLKGILFNEKT